MRNVSPMEMFGACYRVFLASLLNGAGVNNTAQDGDEHTAARAFLVSILGEECVCANEKQLQETGAELRAAIARAAAHNAGQILMKELHDELIERGDDGEMKRVIRTTYAPAR